MFEKVNPNHPDKVADRIAGAIVDKCYSRVSNPKVACEVLIGHGIATVIVETSVSNNVLNNDIVKDIVLRLSGIKNVLVKIVPQDIHLSNNQDDGVRCGDNGIFKGCPITHEQKLLTKVSHNVYEKYHSDGKYLIKGYGKLASPIMDITICQSNMSNNDAQETRNSLIKDFGINGAIYINPLGEWTGGSDVDCGATNRKLGSDMGDGVTGGGLHGKDLSKSDVSVNIVCFLLANQTKREVNALCSIGDKEVMFNIGNEKMIMSYESIVQKADAFVKNLGGFEKFAEWGLIR